MQELSPVDNVRLQVVEKKFRDLVFKTFNSEEALNETRLTMMRFLRFSHYTSGQELLSIFNRIFFQVERLLESIEEFISIFFVVR